jgi:hypothetical protein
VVSKVHIFKMDIIYHSQEEIYGKYLNTYIVYTIKSTYYNEICYNEKSVIMKNQL